MNQQVIPENPFVMTILSREVFCREVIALAPTDLVSFMLAASLVYGPDRIEAAIKATYTRKDSDQIIKIINLVTQATTLIDGLWPEPIEPEVAYGR